MNPLSFALPCLNQFPPISQQEDGTDEASDFNRSTPSDHGVSHLALLKSEVGTISPAQRRAQYLASGDRRRYGASGNLERALVRTGELPPKWQSGAQQAAPAGQPERAKDFTRAVQSCSGPRQAGVLASIAQQLATGHLASAERQQIFIALRKKIRLIDQPEKRGDALSALGSVVPTLDNPSLQERAHTSVFRMTTLSSSLPVKHQSGSLTVLAETTGCLSLEKRTARFVEMMKAALRLAREDQGEPLVALAGRIGQLKEDDQSSAFDDVLARVEHLPPVHQGTLLTALAGQIEHLRPDDRNGTFRTLLGQIRALSVEHRGAPLVALAGQIEHLRDDRAVAFQGVLAEVTRVSGQYPGELLATLSSTVPNLRSERDQIDAFDGIFSVIRRMPDEHHAGLLTKIHTGFRFLRNGARRKAFQELIAAAIHLPPDECRTLVAQITAEVVAYWQPLIQHEGLNAMLDAFRRLPDEHRGDVLGVFVIEATSLRRASDPAKLFIRALDEVKRLPPEHLSVPLAVFCDELRWLPPDSMRDALDSALAAVRRVPDPEKRSGLLTLLVRRIAKVPQPVRLWPFVGVLAQVRALPRAHQDEPLTGLAGALGTLDARDQIAAGNAIQRVREHACG